MLRSNVINLTKGNFKNSKVRKNKRGPNMRRRRKRPRNISSNTSHENGGSRSGNLNPFYAEILVFDDNSFNAEQLQEREDNQLESDFSEHRQWTRTVRSMEADHFGEASHADSAKREKLRTTDTWRKLLLPQTDVGSLLMSEEIFKENVKSLLDGIDLIESKPLQWSRLDTNFYFNKIHGFTDNWGQQLLIEKKRLDEEVWLAKEKLKVKQDLVTNRLSLLTGVFIDSASSMKFSEFQIKSIQTKTEELNIIKNKLMECEGGRLGFQEVSSVSHASEKDRELTESRKQADEYCKELNKTQNKLKETEAQLHNLMFSSNQKLSESRRKADEYCNELNKTQNRFEAIAAELNNLLYFNNQKAELEQKEMQVQLSEIGAMLLEKFNSKNPNGLSFNPGFNKETGQIIQDIKSLIQYQMQSKDKDVEITEDIAQDTGGNSGVLKVIEHEMHLVTLIASFLKVTPFPVSLEFIYTYVAKIDNVLDLQYVESLLKKFPAFFKEVPITPGSTQKNWSYLDLKPTITI